MSARGPRPPLHAAAATPSLRGAAYRSPIGTIVAVASDVGLRAVGFDLDLLAEADQTASPVLDAFGRWLQAYLAREFDRLPDVPLDPKGGPFELQVWEALREVGPGRTVSYGDVADRLKRPAAARAVGAAVGKNPIAIVVPCHRILAANGRLHGYAGGVERKAWLLRHEGALLL